MRLMMKCIKTMGLIVPILYFSWGVSFVSAAEGGLHEVAMEQEEVIDQQEGDWLPLWKRIQEIRLSRLKESLHLSEAEGKGFFAQLRILDEKKRELGKERLFLLRQLKKGTGKTEDTNKQLNAIEANSAALMTVKKEMQTVLKTHLTPEQQVQYILFQQKFKGELRTLILAEKKGGHL